MARSSPQHSGGRSRSRPKGASGSGGGQGGQGARGGRGGRGGGGSRGSGGQHRGRPASGGGQRGPRPGDGRRRRAEEVVYQPAPVPTASDLIDAARIEEGHAIRANRRRSWMLAAAPGLLLGVVAGVLLGVFVSPAVGAPVGVVVVVAASFGVRRMSAKVVLDLLAVRPSDEDDRPRVHNLVEGLCATMGLPRLDVLVVDDPVPNACAVGLSPRDGAVVVTSGLEDQLGLVELEGVLAHELVHVRRHDTAVSAVAVTVLAPLILATGRGTGLLHRATGPGREFSADQRAVAAVRYATGLRDALDRLAGDPVPAGTSAWFGTRRQMATRWLWVDPMVGCRDEETEPGNLDATGVRCAVLGEIYG